MVQGGRREEGLGWGMYVYLWWIHVDIWQNQYNIVKLKKKKFFLILKKKKKRNGTLAPALDPAESLWTESGLGINTTLMLVSCHWEQWALGPRHAPSFWVADWLAFPWVMGQEYPVLLRWAPVLVKHHGKV